MATVSERRKDRLRLVIYLAAFLTSNSGTKVETVCDIFGISRAQLASLLNEMLMIGVPPYGPNDYVSAWIERGRVSASHASWLKVPLRLTPEEAVSLKLMLRSIVRQARDDFSEEARSLELKVADYPWMLQMSPSEASTGRKIWMIAEAIVQRRLLRVVYYKRSVDEIGERMVEPLEFVDFSGILCMVAYCRSVRAEKLFDLSRTLEVEFTDETFEPRRSQYAGSPEDLATQAPLQPEGSPPADASLRMGPPQDADRWFRRDYDPRIKITFSSRRARWAREQFSGADVRETHDGGVEVTLHMDDPCWITDIIGRFGMSARVEGPDELRRWFHDVLSSITDMYPNSLSRGGSRGCS